MSNDSSDVNVPHCPLPHPEPVDFTGFSFLFTGVFQSVVVATGVLGNALVLATALLLRGVNIFGGLRSFVIFLAVCDVALLLTGWSLFALPSLLFGHTIPLYGAMVPFYFVLYPLANAAYLACVWANVLCSVERYLAVCKPLWHHAVGKTKRVRLAFILLCTLSLIGNIPRFFEYTMRECFHDGAHRAFLDGTDLVHDEQYIRVYVFGCHMAFATLGPFAVLVFLNAAILRAARRSELQRDLGNLGRRRSSGNQRRFTQQLTLMFLLISAKFLVSYTLPTVLDGMHVHGDPMDNPIFVYLADVNNVLVAAHSATNYVVYLLCQKRFRTACRNLLCGKASSAFSDQEAYSVLLSSVHSTATTHYHVLGNGLPPRSAPVQRRRTKYALETEPAAMDTPTSMRSPVYWPNDSASPLVMMPRLHISVSPVRRCQTNPDMGVAVIRAGDYVM